MALKIIGVIIILAIGAISIGLYMLGKQSARMSPVVGERDGQLLNCPDSPNCISSFAQTDDKKHYFAPIEMTENPIKKIKKWVQDEKYHIATVRKDYIYFQAKTFPFGFVDDVEFYYSADEQKLYVRSASRVGKSDLGKNKKRVQEVLESLQA